MSEVSSSGSFNYYNRSINELEQDLKDQAARAREADEERIADLEAGYQENVRSTEEGYERTISDIRDHYDSQLESQKRQYQSQLKDQRYNSKGEATDAEGRQLRQEIAMLQEELKARDEAYDRRVGDAESAYGRKLARQREEHSRELEQNAENSREAASQAVSHTAETGREKYAADKARLEQQFSDRVKDLQEQLFLEKKFAKQAVEDIEDTGKHQMRKLERAAEAHDTRAGMAVLREREKEAEALRASHTAETRRLRDELKTVQDKEKEFSRGRAEGRTEAIKDYEDEWRMKMQAMNDAHERSFAKSGDEAKETERYLDRLYTGVMREQDLKFTKNLQENNLEHHKETQTLQRGFTAALDQKELQARKERAAMEASASSRLDRANAERDRALNAQAETYRELFSRTTEENNAKTARLKDKIRDLENPRDGADVPVVAADAIRRDVAAEYQKVQQEDVARNQRAVERLYGEFSEREKSLMQQADSRERDLTQRSALDISQQSAIFAAHIHDTEENKKSAIKSQRLEHDNEIEKLRKNQARLTLELKRRYEDIIDERERETEAKFQLARQESEFNLKMERRVNAQRMAEVVRSYEKMLTDQKEEFQMAVADAKRDGEKLAEEAERRGKLELERQAQQYEHRIAQAEATFKGRERSIAASYEEQLENVRRANARAFRERTERA